MGEVYRARHLKLGREVALKVLPGEVASDPERLQRFEREARTASSLSHPNIVTIHDVDEQEGTHYIAMELVEGRTLRDRLAEGPLPPKEILGFATQIAEGLAKAHAAGIVHRDLKPENLMITDDGRVKILDFGLAKLSPRSEGSVSELSTVEQATRAGMLLGTVPYMSPEQAMGRSVDHRSDQFSFGSILYEMVTGRRAFKKDTAPQTLAAIIEAEPEAADRLKDRVPPALVAIVHRCLAKNPSGRFDSTSDLAEALKRVPEPLSIARSGPTRRAILVAASVLLIAILSLALIPGLDRMWEGGVPGAAAPLVESLAVLPLRNLSGDPEQEYLADGMTEALITDLAKIGALKVIARTSAMRYKGTDKALGEIGSELKVDAVIEGSFLRVGDRVRVTAQLVDVGTQQAVWAESYERDAGDLLALQGEVARAVARQIQGAVAPEQSGGLARARLVDPEAYEAVLKGRFHSYKLTPADLDTALSYFELSLEKDPKYAPAYVGVANVWGGRSQMGYLRPQEAVPRMKAAVFKALELDESLAEAHHSLAALKTWGEWDWPSAEREFERALALHPNNPDALRSHSHFLNIVGRPEKALRQIERALELDPFNAMSLAFHGVDLIFVRRYEEAVARFREALQTSPGLPFANHSLSLALHLQGQHEEALATHRSFLATVGDREGQRALTRGYEEGGYRRAMYRLAETLAARSLRTGTGGFQVAVLYLRAGENERALEWLQRSFENRDPGMPYLGLPQFDPVRDDPRFQDLLRRMNLPVRSRSRRLTGSPRGTVTT